MRQVIVVACLHLGLFLAQPALGQCVVPSYNQAYGVPPNYTASQAFVARVNYPSTPTEKLPSFMNKDFRADWKAYMNDVLDYALDGNEVVDFKVAENIRRDWYHAIWMQQGKSGREFVHGLTKERASRPGQYAPALTASFDTWAVGFYNSYGATEFAKVWADPCDPDISHILFPVGTVSFKLLFTTATDHDLPYLSGSPEWMADTDRDTSPTHTATRVHPVHLLQVDIAVRDDRAGPTGWLFGTFVYNSAVASGDPWRRLRPVGLSWGNDPTQPPGTALSENVVDPTLSGIVFGWAERPEMGWGGRVNGPADNLLSSCESCHGSGQFPRSDDFHNLPTTPATPAMYGQRLNDYFRDIKPGEVFDPQTKFPGDPTVFVSASAVDYSLQMQTGLEHLCLAASKGEKPFDTEPAPVVCMPSAHTTTLQPFGRPNVAAQKRELESVDWTAYEDPIR